MNFSKLNINNTILFSTFRAIFGLLMIQQIIALVPFVYDLQNSHIVLHYPNLEFIEAYSFLLIDILKNTAILGAAILALGLFPRLGAFLFLLSFGYLFLIDMSWYNNHYYLWCLLAFLFIIADTQNSYSVIDIFKNTKKKEISDLAIQSFKILISIVYLYAAIVKINQDWLQGYPATLWFEKHKYANAHLLGLGMSYAGLLYDLSMPILLWFFARKIWIVIPYFAFHISNFFMFNIGVFPIVMIAAWLLFFNKNNKFLNEFKLDTKLLLAKAQIITILLFICFNIIFPLRFLLYEGRTSWHRQGYYFSWRMMLDKSSSTNFKFYVRLPNKNIAYTVNFNQLMTYRQYSEVFKDPYLIWFTAQLLKRDAIKLYNQEDNIEVFCLSTLKLNQHQSKNLVKENFNLANIQYKTLKNNKFINI